ncbi:MAG: ABC transporter ATP-binding protein/permease [Firmicutes bacterium]|nr:ABC transporter ATP-binding protein/permease [Bacillota bacterium]
MLKLTDIKKDYYVADSTVHALKGVSFNFRKAEFVSILGPSGCGKTTLLNLIGGLDHATSGDLAILGKSTKEYRDRDWDVYRNHRIGFVFQSYNLIPHQTVLGNVELALTIAGMSKAERREKAKAALDKVGLSDKYFKKPNQLSGGQCQRVAIARALVNDPEILLADEPTGALDTETSKQVMDLIKEIASEKLVIMVTHNPDLAEEYSTRTIKLLDGNLLSDSNPYSDEEEHVATLTEIDKREQEKEESIQNANAGGTRHKKEKAKMSFITAFKLSVQNLFSKKRRSIMTSIAGSIGIIGIAMVLAMSFGLMGFLNDMQHDMMAANPIEINQTAFDITAMMETEPSTPRQVIRGNWVNVDNAIEGMLESFEQMDGFFVSNRIDRNYVQYLRDMPEEYWSAMHFNHNLDISTSIFTNFNYRENYRRMTSFAGITSQYSAILSDLPGFEDLASVVGVVGSPMRQALDTRVPATEDYIRSQFRVVASQEGHDGIAREKNEVMIVLCQDRLMTDLLLGQIGFYSQEEFINIAFSAMGEGDFDEEMFDQHGGERVQFNELLNHTFTWHPNNNIFCSQNRRPGVPFRYLPYEDMMSADREESVPLRVVGILEPVGEIGLSSLSRGVYFTTALAEYAVQRNWDSEIARFMREEAQSPTLSGTAAMIPTPMGSVLTVIPDAQGNMGNVVEYAVDYSFRDISGTAVGVLGGGGFMSFIMGIFGGGGAGAAGLMMGSVTLQEIGANVNSYVNEDGRIVVIPESDGSVFALPHSVRLYTATFGQKDNVLLWLQAWNDMSREIVLSDGTVLAAAYYVNVYDGDGNLVEIIRVTSREAVQYTDMLSFIMDMLAMLIRILTIALVSFASLSLFVSSVMIGIITYISVVERTKEIGVIRSLGGRKRDVSNLFTAETFILGLFAGLIGITITYLLSAFINLIMRLIDIPRIANLPWWVAIIMVVVSISLTLISGLMPSKSAAKKDPVVALRSE